MMNTTMINLSATFEAFDGMTIERMNETRLAALETEYSDLRLMIREANAKGISTFETSNWIRRMMAIQDEVSSLLS